MCTVPAGPCAVCTAALPPGKKIANVLSIFECVIAIRICERRKMINQNDLNELYHECYDLSRMTTGLIKSVDKR